jgi:hypothetical protein
MRVCYITGLCCSCCILVPTVSGPLIMGVGKHDVEACGPMHEMQVSRVLKCTTACNHVGLYHGMVGFGVIHGFVQLGGSDEVCNSFFILFIIVIN